MPSLPFPNPHDWRVSVVCRGATAGGIADPLDHATAQIPLDPFRRGWRYSPEYGRLQLQPVFFVPDPCALGGEPFASANGRGGANNGYEVTMAGGFHPQDAEPGILIEECDALDEAGDLL